jgi:hypothetical protein
MQEVFVNPQTNSQSGGLPPLVCSIKQSACHISGGPKFQKLLHNLSSFVISLFLDQTKCLVNLQQCCHLGVLLYYMLNVPLFLWPQVVPKREQCLNNKNCLNALTVNLVNRKH